jgi:hypothetical protein
MLDVATAVATAAAAPVQGINKKLRPAPLKGDMLPDHPRGAAAAAAAGGARPQRGVRGAAQQGSSKVRLCVAAL